MNEEKPKLAIVSFTPKVPTPRGPDLKDELVSNMHRHALKQDDLIAAWERHAKWAYEDFIKLAIVLANAERWEDLTTLLKACEPSFAKAAGMHAATMGPKR